MDLEVLTEHLQALLNSRGGEPEKVLRDEANDLTQRIAALIVVFACSDHPLAVSVGDIVWRLTEGVTEEAKPLETEAGLMIRSLVDLPLDEVNRRRSDDALSRGEQMAAAVVAMAVLDMPADSAPHIHLILRALTGRELKWWLQWVRAQRAKE